jgi:hypothetical protein
MIDELEFEELKDKVERLEDIVNKSDFSIGLGANADKVTAKKNDTEEAMKALREAFKADPDYAHSWHCNLAMAFYDAMDENCIDENCKMVWTNAGAARFMKLAFDIETSA